MSRYDPKTAAMRTLSCLAILATSSVTHASISSDGAYLHGSNDSLIHDLNLRKLDPSNASEHAIDATERELDQVAGFATPVWICKGCGMSSHPTLGIIVDTDQLEQIRTQSDATQFSYILRLLLAHEKTHQLQYRTYSATIVDLPDEEREIYEAQADILAGRYLMESMQGSASPLETEATREALRVAYDLGVERYALADHPSHEGRLTAVRLGMAAGMMEKMHQLGGPEGNASAQVLAQKVDFRSGEDALHWSFRTARRIINYRRSDIVNLVLTSQEIDFDKDANHPVVSYQFTYENRGPTPLHVNLEVQSASVPRDEPSDMLRWLKTDVRSYSFTLAPKESHTIKDQQQWVATEELMPRLIAPPTAGALIEVNADTATTSQTQNRGTSGRLALLTTAAERSTVTHFLQTVLGAGLNGFSDLRAGPGRKEDDEVIYPASPEFPGAASTSVWIPEPGGSNDPRIVATLLRTQDSVEADTAYKAALSSVRGALATIGHWDEQPSNASTAKRTYLEFHQKQFTVTVEKTFSGGSYRVSVNVRHSSET